MSRIKINLKEINNSDNQLIPDIKIEELNDTNISSPSDNQILSYDATNNKWINTDNKNIVYRNWD